MNWDVIECSSGQQPLMGAVRGCMPPPPIIPIPPPYPLKRLSIPGGKNPPMAERFFFDFVESLRFRVWIFSFFNAVGLATQNTVCVKKSEYEVWGVAYIVQLVVETASIADRLAIRIPPPQGSGVSSAICTTRSFTLCGRLKNKEINIINEGRKKSYQPPFWFDKGSVGSVHFVVKTTGVT